jgi:hypothetical protein
MSHTRANTKAYVLTASPPSAYLRRFMHPLNFHGKGRRAVRAARIIQRMWSAGSSAAVVSTLRCMLSSKRPLVVEEAAFALGVLGGTCYESLRDALLRLTCDPASAVFAAAAAFAASMHAILSRLASRAVAELLRRYASDDVVHAALLGTVTARPTVQGRQFLVDALVALPDPTHSLSQELIEALLRCADLPPSVLARFAGACTADGHGGILDAQSNASLPV